MKKILVSAFVSAALAGPALSQTAWDLTTDLPTVNPAEVNLEEFARDVDAASGGQLKITVHPSGSLFKATELKRALQMSQVAIGEMPSGIIENEYALFAVDSLPLISVTFEQAYEMWELQKPYLQGFLDNQNIQILFSMPSPPQGLFSKQKIDSKADVAGKRWRGYDPMTSRIGAELGAQPVTVVFAELAQALSVGMVEVFPTSARTGVDVKVWENVKYFYEMDTAFPKRFVIVNKAELEALTPEVQKAVLEMSAKAEERGWQMVRDDTAKAVEELRANGVEVLKATPQFEQDMQAVAEGLKQDWLKRAGADGEALLEAYGK